MAVSGRALTQGRYFNLPPKGKEKEDDSQIIYRKVVADRSVRHGILGAGQCSDRSQNGEGFADTGCQDKSIPRSQGLAGSGQNGSR